jgi:hypothetical protein
MTADTYRIENAAEERGSNRQMLLGIAGDIGDLRTAMLRIDTAVRRWSPVSVAALVIAVVALVIAIVALILVVQAAALRAAVLPLPASLPAGMAALPILLGRQRGLPLLPILGSLAALQVVL